MTRIAVLMTVFNRKEKTLECLGSLYSQTLPDNTAVDVYLVDGGSSDGTAEAVRESFPAVRIVDGHGLFWAGGTRLAWDTALLSGNDYEYFFLLNDDTCLYPSAVTVLLNSQKLCAESFGRTGICIGTAVNPVSGKPSYGGWKLAGKTSNSRILLTPDGDLQNCQLGNANIMMVSRETYDTIGGLCGRYTHGIADFDYTLTAVNKGVPVVVAPCVLGTCSDDSTRNWMPSSVPLTRRIHYLYSVKGLACHEYIYWLAKFFPGEVVPGYIKLWLKTLFPCIWDRYKIQ